MTHRPATMVGFGEIGGGVASEQVGSLSAAVEEQAAEEHRQLTMLRPDGGDHAADGGESVPELQARSPAAVPHQA